MSPAIPLEAFEAAADAFVLSDSGGRIRMLNPSAAGLLECAPDEVMGRRCWEVMGLRNADGSRFCSSDCRVRQAFRDNAACVRQRVVRLSNGGARRAVELLSLQIPAEESGRFDVLHLILPVAASTEGSDPARSTTWGPDNVRGLDDLTPRETEVLRALHAGESTRFIAHRLHISVTTVRNHVSSILRKLGVNRRLEAVMIWIARPR